MVTVYEGPRDDVHGYYLLQEIVALSDGAETAVGRGLKDE